MIPICLKKSPTSWTVTSSPSPCTKMVLLSELSGSPAVEEVQREKRSASIWRIYVWTHSGEYRHWWTCEVNHVTLKDNLTLFIPWAVVSRACKTEERMEEKDLSKKYQRKKKSLYCFIQLINLFLSMHNKQSSCLHLSGCFHTVAHTNTLQQEQNCSDFFWTYTSNENHQNVSSF